MPMELESHVNVKLSIEELKWMLRFCSRSIQLCDKVKDSTCIFDPELGENKEKALILHDKLSKALEQA